LSQELVEVLARHGVEGLPTSATAAPAAATNVASNLAADKAIGAYITSIITGATAFDAATLAQVTRTLQVGAEQAAQEFGPG
jgi:hypothetical protein